MKKFYIGLFLILFLALNNFAQVKKEEQNAALENAKIKITLLNLPGVNLEKSKWEMSYELRIISEKEMYEAQTNGGLNLDTSPKIGESVAKGSFTKSDLVKAENRNIVLIVPLSKEIQTKLKNQPKNRAHLSRSAPDEMTAQSIKDTVSEAQVFLLYASALVYDAKLKKNVIVPLSGIMPFFLYPDANFGVTFKIKENGDFTKNLLLPEKTASPMTTKH